MQTKNLQIVPNGVMPRINVSQYDNGREVHFLLYDGSVPYITPAGSSIRVEGTKKDGTGFSYICSYTGNNVTVIIKEQMTLFDGEVPCELRISKNDTDIGTLNFILAVEKGALSDDIPISDTEIPAIIELAKEEQYSSEAWARGTRNGIPVSEDDPAYHNNSKWYADHSQGGSFATLSDVDIYQPMDGQVPVYNSITGKWENAQAGGGLLPHFYIDSEAGSTVTVVAPDSSIIYPTQISSGHWECDVPDYGVYTIHAVLNGDDAVITQTVDDVKEYHITDAHFSYALNVYAPTGSTIRVTATGETYTGTGAGSTAVPFALHQASTTYTIQVTLDGQTKSDTLTTPSTSGGSGSKNIEYGTINLTYADDFRGQTITCSKSGVTITKTAPSGGNSMVFYPPEAGNYTISGVVSGTTYTTTAEVTSLSTAVSADLQTLPDGKTVLPTDDIQTWLACAGITDKSYTTLSEVLADSTTLLALMSDDNAVDYLVRSTTWASDITADSTAMTDIGANDYCADTLLADNTWLNAICNSTYFESVLNTKVPVMTSNTTPSGVVSANIESGTYYAYKAFDNNDTTFWMPSSSTLSDYHDWIQYDFTNNVGINKVRIRSVNPSYAVNLKAKIQGSNDNFATDSHDIKLFNIQITVNQTYDETITFENDNTYRYWRIAIDTMYVTNVYQFKISELQFYGRTSS